VKKVVHVISLLRELGGVQQSFISYYKYAQKYSKHKQYVYSTHDRSKKYGDFKNFFLIKKNFLSFLLHLYSNNSIIYFHNKLSSKIVYYLLKFMPSNNIIFHEHGEAWNVKTNEQKKIYQANAKLLKK
jgi:chemotaxis methyl-accepting protein methylase